MQLFHPAYIGLERMANLLSDINELSKSTNTNGYPPYNVVKTGDNTYLVELAVAGFKKNQIEVSTQDNILTIKATNENGDTVAHYVHRGIGARSFMRKFTLMDYIEVRNVILADGMLRIELERVVPESLKPRVIEIKDNVDDWKSVMSKPETQLLVEDAETEKTVEKSTRRAAKKS